MSDPGPTLWLLQLEQHSRQQGSAIRPPDLTGNWRLVDLWDRRARPQAAQARLLQGLSAQLEIQPAPTSDATALRLRNSVRVGTVELAFEGPGRLQGRRPLLRFRFEGLAIRLGRWNLWQQSLPVTAGASEPFFALIGTGSDEQGRWLLARGRGGGLARWRCP
jgi:hypothetical protein